MAMTKGHWNDNSANDRLKENASLVFFVNGAKIEEPNPDPEMTLLTYLRVHLQLTGSKLGCGEGGCGACTVMVSHYDASRNKIQAVTTVEGIGSSNYDHLHPVQERLAKFHGSQCGFCTPGIVMSMYTLLRNNPEPTVWEMESFFDGNLCRCTGYRPILDAFQTFTKEFKCTMGDRCCRSQANGSDNSLKTDDCKATFQQKLMTTLKPYDPSQELIFPPELKIHHNEYHSQCLTFQGSGVNWIQPQSLVELLRLKSEYQATAKLVCGNTEVGIETAFKNEKYPVLIYCSAIPELCDVKVVEDGVTVGASVTLSQMEVEFTNIIKTQEEHKTRILTAFVEMLKWFASHQIRNVASLGGNVMTASPISDLNPLLVAAEATAQIRSEERGCRSLRMDNEFFLGYRKTALTDDEILESITIPFTKENEYFHGYKQANRKDDDISLVNAGMSVTLSDNKIQKMTLIFGGMGVTVVNASQTSKAVKGDLWDHTIVPKVCNLLVDDLSLPPGSPGGVVRFRKSVALSFFFKFFLSVNNQRSIILEPKTKSAIEPLIHHPSKGIGICGAKDLREKSTTGAVGNSFPHLSAIQQSTGEAVYIDDMPLSVGELHFCLVTSNRASAKILSIDTTKAAASVGYQGFISADDIDDSQNSLGMIMDTIFASKEVTCQGQIIGGVLADSHSHARKAAKLVAVEYEDRTPIITIKDAIKHGSYYDQPRKLSFGNLDSGFKSSDHVVEGECQINGQNHFYLETNVTRAIPLENDEMEIFCSSQSPTQLQNYEASALGVPMSKIKIRTRRLGGGFGGKETQFLYAAVPTAIAAKRTGKIVRCVVDRDEDMISTGNRHPFLGKYKVGFSSEGKILALDLKIYGNAGNSQDLSVSVLERALLQCFLLYFIPDINVDAIMCKTNIISNTAFRGFGCPQGHFIMENILENVADYLNISPQQVKEKNFYKPDHPSYMFPSQKGDIIRNCWNICIDKSDYQRRRKNVDDYNRTNRWKKKGIALSPLRYGISFLNPTKNQAGALVHVYHDGSVLIAHGGTEMGQGLYVKMAQIAAEVLEVPFSYINNNETSTATVPNTMPTAASCGTDLNGMAVKNACETLKQRLKPFKEENPKGSWEDWVRAAFENRVSLSATGFYKVPGIYPVNFETGEGNPFAYYTIGAACSEVQIDCLTGDHKVLRTDIVMDIGKSINPAIDVGQVQGAFMQGYGLFMLEEIKVTPDGLHLTRGPGTYKIPSFGNIPTEFNVYIVPDSHNPFAVFGSKGIGEPPLLLATSVFFAVKDAIKAARKDVGKQGIFQLSSPAMPANIRMACPDQFTEYFPEEIPGTFKPWFVDL